MPQCEACLKKFTTKRSYQRHMREYCPETKKAKTTETTGTKRKKKFIIVI